MVILFDKNNLLSRKVYSYNQGGHYSWKLIETPGIGFTPGKQENGKFSWKAPGILFCQMTLLVIFC